MISLIKSLGMIKFFRQIRYKLMSENKTSKYLKYAVGEILLVVIGILIALSINNWNQNKREQATLDGYLNSISNNIREDLNKIDFMRQQRINTMNRVPYMYETLALKDYLKRSDVKFASESINNFSKLDYLNSDNTGFESVKNSGFLSKLQGKDIENLIYKYYNLVDETAKREDDFNEILKNSLNEFNGEIIEDRYFLTFPDYIMDDEHLTRLQPSFKEILFQSAAVSLYNHTYSNSPELIVNYENLSVLGKEVIRMIENDQQAFDSISNKNLAALYNINGNEGYSKVIVDGVGNSAFYEFGLASADNVLIEMIQGVNESVIKIPHQNWAAVYLRNPSSVQAEFPTKDFSGYKSIKIELKGEREGKPIFFALKDADDPDDGTESRVPIRLSKEWQTYEFELSEFKTANLKKLFLVATFIVLDEARTFSIRNIEYLR